MSLVSEFPQLSERRNQFLLISSIVFLVTAGATDDLSIHPAIEMKALKELVRTKPRLPGATEREKIVVPDLESIEGSVGLVSGEPLPKILIKLKNSGKKLVNLSFNHISFILYAKGYDGIQITLPNECLDCGPRSDDPHDPPYGLHKTSHRNIDKFSESLETLKLPPAGEVLILVRLRKDIENLVIDSIRKSRRTGNTVRQSRPSLGFGLTLSSNVSPSDFRILMCYDLAFPDKRPK